jgi:hypothetical protein
LQEERRSEEQDAVSSANHARKPAVASHQDAIHSTDSKSLKKSKIGMLHEIRTVAHNGTDYNTMTRSGDSANQAAANSVSSENQEITIQPCGGDSSNKYSGEMMIISRDGAPVLGNCNIFIHLPYGSKDNYLIYCLFSYNAHITFHNLQPARRLWLLLYLVSGNKVPMGILRTEDWQNS